MHKPAPAEHPLERLIAERWSPRAFSERPISPEHLASLLEAARWAPSCFNEQPWRFVVAERTDGVAFERLASCLAATNRVWAEKAPLLVLSIARTSFTRNDKPNRHAWHDVGLAVGNVLVQATALGLVAHQMAGFDPERARAELSIPAGFEPVAMIALGHPGDPTRLPDELRERELAPRTRKPLAELAFGGSFGSTLQLPAPRQPGPSSR